MSQLSPEFVKQGFWVSYFSFSRYRGYVLICTRLGQPSGGSYYGPDHHYDNQDRSHHRRYHSDFDDNWYRAPLESCYIRISPNAD